MVVLERVGMDVETGAEKVAGFNVHILELRRIYEALGAEKRIPSCPIICCKVFCTFGPMNGGFHNDTEPHFHDFYVKKYFLI